LQKSEKDPEIIASRMAVFFYGGYSNFDDIYTSLTNLSATNNTNTEVAQR
jgi:predicted secreted protein